MRREHNRCDHGLWSIACPLLQAAEGAGTMGNDHRWIFGDTGTTTQDSIGNVTGTLVGNVARKGPGRYGLGNAVLVQSPRDSHIDFGTGVGQFGTASFTVMLW